MVPGREPADGLPSIGTGEEGVGREYDEVFNVFFRERYRPVVKAVMYAGASLEDAEDAASNAMIELYIRWPLVENKAAWTRTVAIHDYVTKLQRDRRRPYLEAAAVRREGLELISVQRDEMPDERDRVLTALRDLPRAQRKVMALALDGLEPSKIAEMLQMPPTNVRSNLRHARERLRQGLKDY